MWQGLIVTLLRLSYDPTRLRFHSVRLSLMEGPWYIVTNRDRFLPLVGTPLKRPALISEHVLKGKKLPGSDLYNESLVFTVY